MYWYKTGKPGRSKTIQKSRHKWVFLTLASHNLPSSFSVLTLESTKKMPKRVIESRMLGGRGSASLLKCLSWKCFVSFGSCETLRPKKLDRGTGENRTGEPRPIDWTLSWALPWTPSGDVSWELSWGVLERPKTAKSNPHGCCRGRSRERTRGGTRGCTRGPTRRAASGSNFAFACSVRHPKLSVPTLLQNPIHFQFRKCENYILAPEIYSSEVKMLQKSHLHPL